MKVLICGDGAIGKTCLLDTLCEKDAIDWDAPEYKPTAADNLQRQWCDAEGDDWDVSLWDTAGQEALINLRQSAYPGTQVLLIGFDMTKGVSLENIPTWVEEVSDCEPNVGAVIIIGTKSDFYEELKAGGKGSDGQPLKTMEEMYAMAVQVGAHGFVCTSAKNGYGLLEDAQEGPAAEDGQGVADTMSGQGDEGVYLDMEILRCGRAVNAGDSIAVLESRAAKPAEPVVEEKKPEPVAPAPVAPVEPVAPKPPAPVEPKPTPEAAKPKPDTTKKDDGCCTLL